MEIQKVYYTCLELADAFKLSTSTITKRGRLFNISKANGKKRYSLKDLQKFIRIDFMRRHDGKNYKDIKIIVFKNKWY